MAPAPFRKTGATLLALSLLILAACSGADIINAAVSHEGYTIHRNVAYGTDPKQQMDIYVPDGLEKPAPVLVFFHGGSWQYGSRDDYRFAGQAFASKGFITAVVDYRLYPQVYFPAFVEDGAAAFRFVHEHAGEYGGDPHKLFLAGHSAGAYIAMMLTVNDAYLRAAHAKKAWIRGTIGIAGPYDFLPLTDPMLIDLFSKQDIALTQPINFIHSEQPPIFLAHGLADDTVWLKNTRNVAARLNALHSPVETHYYAGVGHIGIILSLAEHFRGKDPLLDNIAAFVQNH